MDDNDDCDSYLFTMMMIMITIIGWIIVVYVRSTQIEER
jgi:hypothetical protein